MKHDKISDTSCLSDGTLYLSASFSTAYFFRKKITSQFINSALYYLPYAVLGALTFPGVFNSTPNLVESCAGILVAVFFSYKGKGLVFVAVAAILASYIVQFVI